MKSTPTYLVTLAACLLSMSASAETLCFSPVKERVGDISSKRPFWKSFDYRVQVDDGSIVTPSSEDSTSYEFSSKSPLVKIWLGDEIVESFYVSAELIAEGRNCIYFKNIYETWAIVAKWQAEKLCSC